MNYFLWNSVLNVYTTALDFWWVLIIMNVAIPSDLQLFTYSVSDWPKLSSLRQSDPLVLNAEDFLHFPDIFVFSILTHSVLQPFLPHLTVACSLSIPHSR